MDANLTPYVPRLLLDWEEGARGACYRSIDGTLVFMDISGFTAMSERLAGSGKAGSEETTEIMNRVFTGLLKPAYERGAHLLKYGGDAMLLLFDGAAHAERACAASIDMRRELRTMGRFRTSAGSVSLRMSVGVHSGEIACFLAGESHRELIVCGPAVTTTAEMESSAQAGEILVSRSTAASIPPACTTEASGAFLLRKSPSHPESPPAPAIEAAEDPSRFIPQGLVEHLRSGGAGSEHRQVTVAFVHFDGTDELLSQLGPHEVGRRLDALMRTVQTVVEEHGICLLATDIDRDGGKIILAAGAPRATDNDEERMLRAVRLIVDRAEGISVRAGVHRGRVFAGDVGPPYRKTYTVMGDAVNLAARLMAKAGPGEIVVTDDVISRSHTRFETRAMEPFHVKGKSRPIAACTLGQIRESQLRRRGADVPLVGREQEIGFLESLIHAMPTSGTNVVELVGPPGIGKSRLLNELSARNPTVAFHETVAEQYASSSAYSAFRRLLRPMVALPADPGAGDEAALREVVAREAPSLAPWLPLIALVVDVPVASTPEVEQLAPRFRRMRLHEAVVELMQALLPGSTLLSFDDAHWLDEASHELLAFIVQRVDSAPWLICISHRPGPEFSYSDLAANGATMELAPLSAEASFALASAVGVDSDIATHDIRSIAASAGGNPLFVREIVGARAAQGSTMEIPESVEALITAHIDRLPPMDRRALRYASVLGMTVEVETLSASYGDLLSSDALASASLEEFLQEDAPGRLRFKHALTQEVAYDGLPFRIRRDLHERVGAYIERRDGERADEDADILSLHFARAQDHPRSYRYSRIAGERAKSKYANVEAADAFARAIAAARHLDAVEPAELAGLYEASGDVCELAGMYTRASADYHGARRALRDAGAYPGLFRKEGVIRERLGRYTNALRWYTRALRDPRTTERERAHLELAYAGVRFRQGRYGDCAAAAHRALAYGEAAAERSAIAHAYYLLDHAYTLLGNPESAKYRALALPIFEELGDLLGQANVLNNLGIAATLEGRWDEAIDSFSRSREAREKVGDLVGAATASNNAAEVLSDRGYIEDAEQLFREALRTWRAAGYPVGVAVATSNLGRTAARTGRLDESAALYADALASFREMGAETFVFDTEARDAERVAATGDDVDAERAITAAIGHGDSIDGSVAQKAMLQRLLGEVLARRGLDDCAAEAFERSLQLSRSLPAPYEEAMTLQAQARATMRRGLAGDELLRDSMVIQERLGIVATPLSPVPRAAG